MLDMVCPFQVFIYCYSQVSGNMEEVAVVKRDDPVWVDYQMDEIVRVCQSEFAGEGRDKKLCSELQFGNTCTSKVKDDLRLIVRKYNDVFALTDDELGETSVVAHACH